MNIAIARPEPRVVNASEILDLCGWLLVSFYLYADTVSGVLAGQAGGAAPLSQAWKGMILATILLRSLIYSHQSALIQLGFLAALLMGPVFRLAQGGEAESFVREASTALKVMVPLYVLLWCNDQQRSAPGLLAVWPKRALWLAAIAVIGNVAIGLAGYGFTSYGTRASGGLGTIGFFQAGNEVGGTFAVLCAFLLMQFWKGRRWLYWPLVALLVGIGLLIATKSAILSAALIGVLLPIAYLRGKWGRMKARSLIAMLLLLVIGGTATVRLWDSPMVAAITARIEITYRERGWLGVVLSSRDVFVRRAFHGLEARGDTPAVLLGIGAEALQQLDIKESVEMDPLDLYLWFGLPGALYAIALGGMFLYAGVGVYRNPGNESGPAILLVNLTLLTLSVLAGHVLFGGMAGIAWATLNGLGMAGQQPDGIRRLDIPAEGRAFV
jgi:hypothetical protein